MLVDKLQSFSLELYDIDSNIKMEMTADHIDIKFNGKEEIILWLDEGNVYPQIVHDFEHSQVIELSTLLKILNIVEKYMYSQED